MNNQLDQSQPDESSAAKFKKLGGAMLCEARRSAHIAAATARIEKLKRLDLSKARQKLGQRAYAKDILRDMFPAQHEAITRLRSEIDAKILPGENVEGSLAKIKKSSLEAVAKAEAEAMRVKLNGLFRDLGARVENIDVPEIAEDQEPLVLIREAIADEELKLAEFTADQSRLGEHFHDTVTHTRDAVQAAVSRRSGWGKRLAAALLVLALLGGSYLYFSNSGNKKIRLADMLAAHPDDRSKPADIAGVPDSAFDSPEKIERAVEACIAAVEAEPDDPRQRFQLGRVLLMAGLEDESYEQLRIAAEGGHEDAAAYLARFSDEEEEFFPMPTGAPDSPVGNDALPDFAGNGYKNPAVLAAFYTGDLEALNRDRVSNVIVVRDMAAIIHQNCPLLEDPALGTHLLASVQRDILGGGSMEEQGFRALGQMLQGMADPQRMLNDAAEGEVQTKKANQDAIRLLETHGCDGQVTRKVYAGMCEFLRSSPN